MFGIRIEAANGLTITWPMSEHDRREYQGKGARSWIVLPKGLTAAGGEVSGLDGFATRDVTRLSEVVVTRLAGESIKETGEKVRR